MDYCCPIFEGYVEAQTIFYWKPDKQWQIVEEQSRFCPLMWILYCPFCGQKLESKDPVDEAIKLVKKVKEKRDDE